MSVGVSCYMYNVYYPAPCPPSSLPLTCACHWGSEEGGQVEPRLLLYSQEMGGGANTDAFSESMTKIVCEPEPLGYYCKHDDVL